MRDPRCEPFWRQFHSNHLVIINRRVRFMDLHSQTGGPLSVTTGDQQAVCPRRYGSLANLTAAKTSPARLLGEQEALVEEPRCARRRHSRDPRRPQVRGPRPRRRASVDPSPLLRLFKEVSAIRAQNSSPCPSGLPQWERRAASVRADPRGRPAGVVVRLKYMNTPGGALDRAASVSPT